MSRIYMQSEEKFVETPIPRARTWVEDEAHQTPHSHTSERQGNEAGNVRQKRERKEGLALRGRNKSSPKAIAVPLVM